MRNKAVLDSTIRGKIDRIRDVFWPGGISTPYSSVLSGAS